MQSALEDEITFGRGLIVMRDAPHLANTVRRAVTRSELRPLLPGIYVPADLPVPLPLRARAIMRHDPAAIILGAAAASLQGWPGITEPPTCEVATHFRGRCVGYRFSREEVPSEHVVGRGGIRLTSVALTALHLARQRGGAPLDEALRLGVRLSDLWEVFLLQPGRPGNAHLRSLLVDSRDEPWSEAERAAHRALRAAGIRGWSANLPILLDGRRRRLDLGFAKDRVAVEIDGRGFHCSWEQRSSDMARDRKLAAAGWRVLRFPAGLVLADPDRFVRELLAALAWGACGSGRVA